MLLKMILLAGLGLGSMFDASKAFAHGDHGEEPFAQKFDEIRRMKFMVREPDPGAETAYIHLPDGTRVALDERFQSAARRLAGSLYEHEPAATPKGDRPFVDQAKRYGLFALKKLEFFFSRKFVLELSGVGVEAFYRFGLVPAVVLVATEIVDHSPINIFAVPLCPVIYGTWEFCSKEAQETSRVLTRAFPQGVGLGDRLKMWGVSKSWRARGWRGSKKVRLEDGVRELNAEARDFKRHAEEPGMDALFGGLLKPGFFRNAFARPIMITPEIEPSHPRDHVPRMADFPVAAPEGERVLLTEQYINFIEVIIQQAQLTTGDLLRKREEVEGQMRRVPLRETLRRWPGYIGLRRDLARMRRAFDLYAYGLRLRAVAHPQRSATEVAIDEEFAESLGRFLETFSARVERVDSGRYIKVAAKSLLRSLPKQTLNLMKAWIRRGEDCAADLLSTPVHP